MADSQKLVLPLEYQEVEYIENTGTTQYIDTGWKRDFNKDFEIEAVIKPSTINKRYCIISDYSSQYQYNMSFEVTGDNFGRVFINAANNLVGTHIYNSNEFNIFKYSYDYTAPSGTVEVNSYSNSKTYQTEVRRIAADNARIFVDKDSRFSVFNYSFKLQKMRIKEDNVLIRNFIPCYRKSDNEAGLYDTVNDVFYTNQGTGSFTVGANVSSWKHSLRKLTTATEAVENPLYSDGTSITAYTIKGNEEHTGTPSPQNPVEVNGVGVRTENLFDVNWWISKAVRRQCTATIANSVITMTATSNDPQLGYATSSGGASIPNGDKAAAIEVEESTTYTLALSSAPKCYVTYYDSSWNCLNSGYNKIPVTLNPTSYTFTTPANCKYITLRLGTDTIQSGETYTFSNIMLVEGETAPTSYIPYGYKIPVLSGGVTTNIYLGSTQNTRQIGKITFDGSDDEQWSERQSPANSYVISIPAARVDGICTHLTQVSAAASLVDDTMYVGATAMSMKVGGISSLTDFKAWLAANKPTVWYVLATPETAAVNEPLMKIGDYVDTLSNAVSIPTTEGANSISVDTTVQPSEFTATWTGWHNASVKEKSENLFDKGNTTIYNAYFNNEGEWLLNADSKSIKFPCLPNTQYTLSVPNTLTVFRIYESSNPNLEPLSSIGNSAIEITRNSDIRQYTFTTSSTAQILLFQGSNGAVDEWFNSLMLNTGSTAKPYEPYWK